MVLAIQVFDDVDVDVDVDADAEVAAVDDAETVAVAVDAAVSGCNYLSLRQQRPAVEHDVEVAVVAVY